jgi:hypothetical protein
MSNLTVLDDSLRREMDDVAYVIACAVANGRKPSEEYVQRFVRLRERWFNEDPAVTAGGAA